jgi:glycosyltransferase involved in cell wall biosynthesis
MVVFALYPYSETRVQRQAEALVHHGYEVDVICPTRPGLASEDKHSGVNIYRVAKIWQRRNNGGILTQLLDYMAFFILASLKLIKLQLTQKYTVVQAHNIPDFLVFTALIPKLLGARVILDLHDLMPEFFRGKTGQDFDSFSLRLILLQERLSCRFADHVITVTEHWRQALIERGVPPEKCSVVMNLADPRIFKPLTDKKNINKNGNQFRLFYHGYMPKRYGLDLILLAMDKIRSKIPEIHLTLVGGGDYRDTLIQLAAELKLNNDHIEFIRTKPVEELPSLIAAADVAVVPYRDDIFADTLLPTKLLEYAVMGLPAIVARTTAISSYFDESMVKFFKPGDVDDLTRCIVELYNDPDQRQRLSEGIRRFNEHFNWEKQSAVYLQVVDQLASIKGVPVAN